jgi:serine/threonine protein kinase
LSHEEFEAIVQTEVSALERMRNINHPHLIQAIAYYKKGSKHCVIFPWAQRGNLRDFWKKPPPKLSPQYLKWAFNQFLGIAGAIERLHHSDKDQAIRHGDLKPENILCFDGKGGLSSEQDECTMVIADVGLSKSHEKLTELRKEATHTHSGTIMYEPPETELQSKQPRSRRYDIWSLGCIYLEFAVWLLYGEKELDRFRSDLTSSGNNPRFFVIDTQSGVPQLNNAVDKWVTWIRNDRRCPKKTAIRCLVELVVSRMLITDVSNAPTVVPGRTSTISRKDSTHDEHPTISFKVRSPTMTDSIEPKVVSSKRPRATAEEVLHELRGILENAADKKLEWIEWSSPTQQGPRQYGSLLDTSDRRVAKEEEVR